MRKLSQSSWGEFYKRADKYFWKLSRLWKTPENTEKVLQTQEDYQGHDE
jgi:hypothetical protein